MPDPIYAIGDIHGQMHELDRALARITTDGGKDAHIVFLGDYTDRGPDSRAVLDTLIAGQAEGRNWTCLKGNHDRMFQWFMEDEPRHDPYLMIQFSWLHERLGGDTTLASYGVDAGPTRRQKDVHAEARAAVPRAHVDFLAGLRLTHETETLFFVHAGIRPGVPLVAQTEEDMIWIRDEFHRWHRPHPRLIIHGHTPVTRPTHFGNRVNLDTGAGYGDPLTTAVFEDGKVWHLTEAGRMPLLP